MSIGSIVFLSTNTLISNSVINVIFILVINLDAHAFLLRMRIIVVLHSQIPNIYIKTQV